jgi:hypothetical protein
MVVFGIVGFFLAAIWLVVPFVIFAIKGEVDRAVTQLEGIERRLDGIEASLARRDKPVAPPGNPVEEVSLTSGPDGIVPPETTGEFQRKNS